MLNGIKNIFKTQEETVLSTDFSKFGFIDLNNFLAKLEQENFIVNSIEFYEHFKKHILKIF